MAINNIAHVNECGLPLNAIEWLVKHHQSKFVERGQMVRDLHIEPGQFVVDAGCGPGLWTPSLAQAVGVSGHILGVDISPEALVTAQKRSTNTWYRQQVQYKRGDLENLPIRPGVADLIFSANVSQYLPDPIGTFTSMGGYLKPGGRIVIKDIDFGTMRFSNVDPGLQARVLQARERWEQERVSHGYAYEDSWVGTKLAGYLRAAGFKDVQEKTYRIVRSYPLPEKFRFYLQGIAEWFVCEGAPYLTHADSEWWRESFLHETQNVLNQEDFNYEETEFVVSGVWEPRTRLYNNELHIEKLAADSTILN